MYQLTSILILPLFTLHLTKICWAQEPACTTDALEIVTIVPPSDSIPTDSITINDSVDYTTFTMPDSPIATPGITSDSIGESSFASLVLEVSLSEPDLEPSSTASGSYHILPDFTATVDRDIIQECDAVTISWSGKGITSPYRLFYSKGTGEIGDTSILGEEAELDWSCTEDYLWNIPLNSKTPAGNVTRIVIVEDDGMGRSTTLWMPWQPEGFLEECDPFLLEPAAHQTNHLSYWGTELPTLTRWPLWDDPAFTLSVNDHIEEIASATEKPDVAAFVPVSTIAQTPSGAPTPTPTQGPVSMRIASPNLGRTATNAPGSPWVADRHPNPGSNSPRPSGTNNPSNNVGDVVQLSTPTEGNAPQSSNPDGEKPDGGFRMTLVSVGANATLTVVTEIPLGTSPARESHATSGMQPYIGPATTPSHDRDNTLVRGGLPPASIGAIVGSLLAATILWILFVIWLKKRKRSRRSKEPEETIFSNPSHGTNGVTPFVAPTAEQYNPVNPDSKRRLMQEIPRAISPVTSIGDSVVHSEFYTVPITESLSEDLYSIASSSDPFKRPFQSHRDSKETQLEGSGW